MPSLRPYALLLLLPLAATRAQESLFTTPWVSLGTRLSDVDGADLDGDGDLDALALSQGDGTLVADTLICAFNPGGGRFTPPVTLAAYIGLQRFVVADFDGNGTLDLAASLDAAGPDAVLVLRGQGDGSFGAPQFLGIVPGPLELRAADLDGDGALDLAVACPASKRLSLLFGHGDGSFEPHVDLPGGPAPVDLAVLDLDADLDADLLVLDANTGLRPLLGDGTGGFVEQPKLPSGAGAKALDVGDLDSDGAPDVVIAYGSGKLRLAFGNGAGGFGELQTLDAGPYGGTVDVLVADVDEDGDADVVHLLEQLGAVVVRLSLPGQALAPPQSWGARSFPAALAAGDFTGDGDVDLLVGSSTSEPQSGGGTLLPGRGDGTFGPFPVTAAYARSMAAADLDGDGRLDLVTASFAADGGSGLHAHRNAGFGSFEPDVQSAPLDSLLSLQLADVNEDGKTDAIACRGDFSGAVAAYLGDGALHFGAAIDVPLSPLSRVLLVADLDGDAHLDAAASSEDGLVHLAYGDGAGGFTAAGTLHTSDPGGLAAADLDGDGIVDLIVGGHLTPTLDVVRGLGGGAFAAPVVYPALSPFIETLALGDIDLDGDLDIGTPTESGGPSAIVPNDGGELLAPKPLPGVAGPTHSMAIADLDRDGLPDVAAAAWYGLPVPDATLFPVLVWPGTGRGELGPVQSFPVSAYPKDLLVRDFDGDGALDVAALSSAASLAVLLNQLGPWEDLGHALAGTQGLPRLVGSGSLQPGSTVETRLTDARPGGMTAEFIGLAALSAPFKGGVLVPLPTLVLPGLPLDAHGDLVLSGTWPGPASQGVQVFLQFWTFDPAAPKGLSASNALRATLP